MLTLDTARNWYPESDAVHGFDHVQRVLLMAERIAQEEGADLEIVQAAALLHDANPPQENPLSLASDGQRLKHHHASAEFAAQILKAEGWSSERIAAVVHCIRAHRFRDRSEPPDSLEAKILFDADKLDAIGAIGAARAVAYAAQAGQPAWAPVSEMFLNSGQCQTGEAHSAYHEFLFKLRKLQARLYTPTARRIAAQRHQVMADFFARLELEMRGEA